MINYTCPDYSIDLVLRVHMTCSVALYMGLPKFEWFNKRFYRKFCRETVLFLKKIGLIFRELILFCIR